MLRLRAGTATLLIGPRATAGVHGGRYCLDSETDIRQRLTLSLQDPASREAMRRFWAHWQSDIRLAGVKDQSIIDRIARMSVRGPLIVFLVTDTSVHRRDSSAARAKQVAEAKQNQIQFKPWNGPVKPQTLVTVSMVTPAATKTPAPVDRSIITSKKAVGDWTIAEKLTAIVMRSADSRKLSLDTQTQLKKLLAVPKFAAWLVGSLLVWFVSQVFLVGEIFDMLLAGAALVLSGAGMFFSLQSLVGAAHLVGQFIDATRSARDDKDLGAAADILAEIIAVIGLQVLIAALAHATTRATSEAKPASTVRKPPEQKLTPPQKLSERPPSNSGSQSSRSSDPKKSQKPTLNEKEAKSWFDHFKQDRKDIPFDYPVDCCYTRAREMAKEMTDKGVSVRKAWNYARNPKIPTLHVPTSNVPSGSVNWVYHVAPVVSVEGPDGKVQDMIIDPSMSDGPIPIEQWKSMQNDPQSKLELTSSDPYYRAPDGTLVPDPGDAAAQAQLAEHRVSRAELWSGRR